MLTTQERQKILAQNEAAAAELAQRFDASGTLVVDLISGPGTSTARMRTSSAIQKIRDDGGEPVGRGNRAEMARPVELVKPGAIDCADIAD